MKKTTLGILLIILSLSITAQVTQWRGPNRDNVSPDTGLLTEWQEQGPPLIWRVRNLGQGIA